MKFYRSGDYLQKRCLWQISRLAQICPCLASLSTSLSCFTVYPTLPFLPTFLLPPFSPTAWFPSPALSGEPAFWPPLSQISRPKNWFPDSLSPGRPSPPQHEWGTSLLYGGTHRPHWSSQLIGGKQTPPNLHIRRLLTLPVSKAIKLWTQISDDGASSEHEHANWISELYNFSNLPVCLKDYNLLGPTPWSCSCRLEGELFGGVFFATIHISDAPQKSLTLS